MKKHFIEVALKAALRHVKHALATAVLELGDEEALRLMALAIADLERVIARLSGGRRTHA